jgi:uncharacterized membrane protein YqhA
VLARLLAGSRYLILLAVVSTFAAATTLLVYGTIETFVVLLAVFREAGVSAKGARALQVAFIDLADLFLVGTVLYVMALGLYELFIDDRLPLPAWLEIHDVDDLKGKLVGVVVVVLAVFFLGEAVGWDGERNLLWLGGGIALVIAALTYFLSQKAQR